MNQHEQTSKESPVPGSSGTAAWNQRWWLCQLTPEAAEAHDRFVLNIPQTCALGWKPYNYRATRGAVSQWACHTDQEFKQRMNQHGLKVLAWSEWRDGVRTAQLVPA